MILPRVSISNKWVSFLVMLAGMLLPAVAFAQGGPFDLADDDLSKRTFIDPLFGPLLSNGTASPLTTLMMSFNSALLVVGGILLAYTIVAGTMSTAHDGEMLGKKWSSMWIPIRTSIGVAAVMPVIGGGWCVAQAIVVWLSMQGAGLANTLWASFIGPDLSSVANSATYNPPSALTAVRDTYAAMLVNSTCVAAYEKQRIASGTDAGLMQASHYTVDVEPGVGMMPSAQNDTLTITYASNGMIGGMTGPRCGKLVISEDLTDKGLASVSGGTNSTSSNLLSMDDIAGPVAAARWKEIYYANDVLQALAAKIAAGESGSSNNLQQEVDKTMNDLLARYSTNVNQVAKTEFSKAVSKNGEFVDRMKRDGWVMAGAFYMQISKAQDMVSRAVTNVPTTMGPNLAEGDAKLNVSGYVADALTAGDADEVRATTNLAKKLANNSAVSSGSLSMMGASASDASSSDSKWGTRLVNWFINKDETGLFSGGRTEVVDVNENPIIMAKGLGEKMTASAWVAFGSFATITLGGTGGIGTTIAPIFSALFMALIIPGATLSTYLPMLPYILWLGVVLGWAILLIEAVVAAPLWAIVHLAPDGDGIVGRGGQGYMLVLSLVLRPPLMIIGLAAAFVLMKPIGFLINSTFVGAFDLGVSPGFFGITQAFAGCIIYAVLMVITVQRVFSLIHVIPDRLLRWIGGGSGGELGQEAGALDQASNAKLGAALGAANSVSNSLMSTAATAQRDRIAKRDNQQHALMQRDLGEMQALESSRGDATDKHQDAQMAGDRAAAARSRGGGDEGLESAAAVAYDRAARQSENLASKQAARDNSPQAKEFRDGLAVAQTAEAAGSAGAVNNYLNAQGTRAQQARQNGESLPAFAETMANRQDMVDRANSHRREINSVRDAKRLSGEVQEARAAARVAANEAFDLARSSNSPAAKQFVSEVARAKNSGVSGAREQVAQAATVQAHEDSKTGAVEPFQQALIDRDNHIKRAQALESRVAQPDPAPQVDPLIEGDDVGDRNSDKSNY